MSNGLFGLNRFYYAGIGSRAITSRSSYLMMRYSCAMAFMGGIVRSGGAYGSDTSFETGAKIAYDKMVDLFGLRAGEYANVIEVHLPWNKFNGLSPKPGSGYYLSNNAGAFDMASSHHPYWARLSSPERKLMARNSHQIMGLDMRSPSRFVACETPDGAFDRESTTSRSGGTGQAIRIADACAITVYNLKNKSHLEKIEQWLEDIDIKIFSRYGVSPMVLVDNYIKNESLFEKSISGDLVQMTSKGDFDVLVHGVNCQAVMNAGIAKQVRDVFPGAYRAMMDRNSKGKSLLGMIDVVDVIAGEKNVKIINAYTQLNYGRTPDVLYVDYDAIRKSFSKIAQTIEKGQRIAIPKIGSGLGNGCWTTISKIIKNELSGHDITLVNFKDEIKHEYKKEPVQESFFDI